VFLEFFKPGVGGEMKRATFAIEIFAIVLKSPPAKRV